LAVGVGLVAGVRAGAEPAGGVPVAGVSGMALFAFGVAAGAETGAGAGVNA
jgi:hypothetical protein